MTGRILDINPEPEAGSPPPPKRKPRNGLLLALSLVVLYAATGLILFYIVPEPHSPVDYLIAGSLATLLCLLVLFAVAIKKLGTAGARRPR